jgi:hypothetical protein
LLQAEGHVLAHRAVLEQGEVLEHEAHLLLLNGMTVGIFFGDPDPAFIADLEASDQSQQVLPQLMSAILAGVAKGYSAALGKCGSVVMISSNVPFGDLLTPALMLLFPVVRLLLINRIQI